MSPGKSCKVETETVAPTRLDPARSASHVHFPRADAHDKTRLSPAPCPILFLPYFSYNPTYISAQPSRYSRIILHYLRVSSPRACLPYQPDLPVVIFFYQPRIISVQRSLLSTIKHGNTNNSQSQGTSSTRDRLLSCNPHGFLSLYPGIPRRTSFPLCPIPGTMTASVAPSYSASLDMDNVQTPARYITLLSILHRRFYCNCSSHVACLVM